MTTLQNKQLLALFVLFFMTHQLTASAQTASAQIASAQAAIANKKTAKKSSAAANAPQAHATKTSSTTSKARPLTASESQMIEDFIKKTRSIPDQKEQRKNYNKYHDIVELAYKAYEKLYHYENYISADGMNISEAKNKEIKDSTRILFKAKHIENMVWQLKKDKRKRENKAN